MQKWAWGTVFVSVEVASPLLSGASLAIRVVGIGAREELTDSRDDTNEHGFETGAEGLPCEGPGRPAKGAAGGPCRVTGRREGGQAVSPQGEKRAGHAAGTATSVGKGISNRSAEARGSEVING